MVCHNINDETLLRQNMDKLLVFPRLRAIVYFGEDVPKYSDPDYFYSVFGQLK